MKGPEFLKMFNGIPSACRVSAKHIYVSMREFRLPAKDEEYRKYYSLLGVKDGSDQEVVRHAFVTLAKQYHPDSDSPKRSTEKFREIEHAYRMLRNKIKEMRDEGDQNLGTYRQEKRRRVNNDEVQEFDIKHTAPQHRQYLTLNGDGRGNPLERQRQHQKIKAANAMEKVFDHKIARIQKLLDEATKSFDDENSLVVQDQKKAKDGLTRYGMERLVEDLIQESMARGDFDNLEGSGKPLKQLNEYNPYIDFSTHKMNQIMIDNGFMPTWITLQKEIRDDSDHIRSMLTRMRANYGAYPLPKGEERSWRDSVMKLEDQVEKLNKKIGKFNLTVPILDKQMLLFDLMKESEKILINGKAATDSSRSCSAEKLDSRDKDATGMFTGLINTVLQRVCRQG